MGGQQLDLGPRGDQPFRRVENRTAVARVRGHDGHPDLGPAVKVQVAHLGRRN